MSRLSRRAILACFGILTLIAAGGSVPAAQPAAAAQAGRANPLLTTSTLPFQAPPFDNIKDADFAPAFDEGMRQQDAEVDVIANNPAAPTFDNTLVGARAERPDADARADGLQRADIGQHERHAAEAPGGSRAEARRASGRDHAEREAVRPHRNALQLARAACTSTPNRSGCSNISTSSS